MRKHDEQNLHITSYELNYNIKMETIPPSKPVLERELLFEEDNSSTILIDSWNLEIGGPSLIQKLASQRVRCAVKENLHELKELLETGKVTLQDGRQVKL